MGEFRGLFKTFWNWLTRDTPELIAELFYWLVGDTWIQFGIRLTFLCFAAFLTRSLWVRLADVGDRSPLATIAGVAVLIFAAVAALGAYYAGMWREIAPAWIP